MQKKSETKQQKNEKQARNSKSKRQLTSEQLREVIGGASDTRSYVSGNF